MFISKAVEIGLYKLSVGLVLTTIKKYESKKICYRE